MIIKDVQFIKSAVKPNQYPEAAFPEIAFAGRSNVGKSSLINTLINRKKMVKTSSKPGCTQLINFFLINDGLSFVDLPGYGYAKVSKKIRAQWGPMVERYILSRETLLGVILLLDIRRKPGKEELELAAWFEALGLPFLIVLTKADKLSKPKQQKAFNSIAGALGRQNADILIFSSKSKQGKAAVWNAIDMLVDHYITGNENEETINTSQ